MDAGRFCFTRQCRLLRPAEFQRVFQGGCKSGDGQLLVIARRNECGYARLGLAISLKATGTAVVRNRIKRVVRESFRHHRATLGNLDFVVTGRAGLARKTNQELRTALTKHWVALVECKKS